MAMPWRIPRLAAVDFDLFRFIRDDTEARLLKPLAESFVPKHAIECYFARRFDAGRGPASSSTTTTPLTPPGVI